MAELRLPGDVVELVRARRRELGETQAEFAVRVGRTQAWVSQFETGITTNVQFATVLEVLGRCGLRMSVGAEAPAPRPAAPDPEGDLATGFEDDDEAPSP